jgi:ribosomal protein L21
MYAVIVTAGNLPRGKGRRHFCGKSEGEAESEFSFDTVLAVGEVGNLSLANPTVAGASHMQGCKKRQGKMLNIMTYAPRRAACQDGHRQPYTKIEITEIVGNREGNLKWHIKKG